MVFADRSQAGRQLAEKLTAYRDGQTVVYALPRGGVVVGAEIARAFPAPLDIIVSRKIGHPLQPEFGIAAVTENGQLAINEKYAATVEENWLKNQIENERIRAANQRKEYLRGIKLPSPQGKTAILVDDGVATGLTTKAAIEDLKSREPKMIILAVPVAPKDIAEELEKMVDRLVGLEIAEDFLGAVGAYYESFPQVSDEEVVSLLKKVNAA